MSTKKSTNTKSSGNGSGGAKKIAKRVKSAGTAKPKLKINTGALAKSERPPSPGTLMRAHGHKLVQMWVSKQLQSAILDRARAKGVRISDVLRETVGKEAEKWSGAAVGSLQTLRFVSGGAGAGKNGAKSVKSATKSAPAAKPAAKSARKASPRSSAARGGAKSAADVVAAAGSGDTSADAGADAVAE